jgi:hypothetical protein
MTFANCSLSDLEHEIFAAASASSASALDRCTVQLVLLSLRDVELTAAVLQRHPRVRWASWLV